MRKLFIKLAALVLVFVMCITSLVGCGLVTTDSERDMNQVVATIQIDGAPEADTIYKKDMIMAYLNYGYMYEQEYGYSTADTFKLIVDSLVNNRILVQSVIKAQYDEAKGWEIENYLSDDGKIEAKYSAIKSMNSIIESYKTQPDAEKQDSLWSEVRAVPTNATNEVKEDDKAAYVQAGVIMEDNAEFRKAYNKFIEILRQNELLGDDYKVNDITTTDFYKQTLKEAQESQLINEYQKVIIDGVIAKFTKDENGNVTLDKLNAAYLEKKDAQSELSNTQLVEKFSAATVEDPVLVGANGKYGYVYNLLLGADSTLTKILEDVSANKDNLTKEQYALERKAILDETVVIDQRSSWITSGYDFDGTKFTGDYTLVENTENSLPFYGTVTEIKAATEDEGAKYRVDAVKNFNLKDFVKVMEEYVYGAEQTGVADSNPSVYKKVQLPELAKDKEYENKINELLFAFSTDPGSLNTYKGYLIKPVPEGSNAEEYMQEFADGARELITMGGSSYIMVATDYGYHVMFFSEVLDANYGFNTLTDYLNDLYGAKDWVAELTEMLKDWNEYEDAENYLYLLGNSLFSTEANNAVTNYQREVLNKYRYAENGGVTIYEDRYADLLA